MHWSAALVGLACIGLVAWMTLAIFLSPLEPPWLRAGFTDHFPICTTAS